MSDIDKLEDYLSDCAFYDRYPESHEVRKLHDKVVKELKEELEKLRAFKEWCVHDVRYFTTPARWENSDMKSKLNELGLKEK